MHADFVHTPSVFTLAEARLSPNSRSTKVKKSTQNVQGDEAVVAAAVWLKGYRWIQLWSLYGPALS